MDRGLSEYPRQYFIRTAGKGAAKVMRIGWHFWADIKCPCALHPRLAHKARRRFHNARAANAQKDIRALQGYKNRVQLVWPFSKPAYVRPDHPAAFATRDLRAALIKPFIGEWRPFATLAAALEQLAMHVDCIL